MRSAREARIWVYRDLVAVSLRKRAAALKREHVGPNVTPAGMKRVQREMERLAGWLEAKAAKYEAALAEEPRTIPPRTWEALASTFNPRRS